MSGLFLSEGVNYVSDEAKKRAEDIAKKKAAGLVKIRVINTMTNKMETVWVEKDAATIKWEKEEEQRAKLEAKMNQLNERAKMLEIAKQNKEIEERAAELDALEKEIFGEKEDEGKAKGKK